MSDLQNPSWQGLLLRVGLFAVIGYGSMLAIPFVIFALAGPVLTATLTSFGASAIAKDLDDLADFPSPDTDPDFYVDYGETGPFIAAVGDSECAV